MTETSTRFPEHPAKLDLLELQSLTNLDDIQEALRLLDSEESLVDSELDQILASKSEVYEALEGLDVIRPKLVKLTKQTEDMVDNVIKTSYTAENISYKVRQLDFEQYAVKEAIKKIGDTQELKECISGLHAAIETKDYESGAALIRRYLSLDPLIFDEGFAYFAVSSEEYAENPRELLENARNKLVSMVVEEFEAAVRADNQKDIGRYFKLFPVMGKEEQGLDEYSQYVCGIISKQAQENLAKPVTTATFFPDILMNLFETIAIIIDQHTPVKVLRVIQRLEQEGITRGRRIIDSFREERQISRRIAEINSYISASKKPPNPNKATDVIPEPKTLDVLLNELVMICQRVHLYHRFMHSRAQSEISILRAKHQAEEILISENIEAYDEDGLLLNSELNKLVQELTDDCITMESFYLRRSVERAIKMDEYENGNLTSSSVDDVFYLLKKCCNRTISIYNVECLKAMIGVINDVLENNYIGVFQKRLSGGISTEARDENIIYMVLLNDVDVSCDYLQKLLEEVQNEALKIMSALKDGEKITVQTCLASLNDPGAQLKQILQTSLTQLANQRAKPRVRPILQESYKDVKYLLGEEEYVASESDQTFTKRFTGNFDRFIGMFKQYLTENNYRQLMAHLVEAFASDWERMIVQFKFTQLGALRLDKDIRTLTTYFSTISGLTVRDKFTRINQIAVLLNLDQVYDIYDYWGDRACPATWRLTQSEVRKILGLRTDFRHDDIAKLKF
ncbi:COG4-domain-containing protein [Basidiobolus meristosporus CBS 931.73]|uniref:Conserved oligomeric Golgi complex subunit 4 n=1 Tax=Basidiobolus meristosporus CBS 931.73 TaxID=1314790 RepID=A0A1Y1YMA6_9FUNG|nr:COG4-domain-containing protein [Basidiobolus meristosporus CBS 931.73]|eukprot:ORX99118.1 COG4-domain-containing protein [Basidiobolus meristosporus CBS 931.73]